MIDFTQSPQEIIARLFSEANGVSVPADALIFGTPEPVTDAGARRNTKMRITGIPAKGVTGTVEVYYNRVHINTTPGQRSRAFPVGSMTQLSELVAAVNAAYGINLTPADYVAGSLPSSGSPAQLAMAPGSLVFYGQLDYQLSGVAVPAEDLTHLVFRDTFTDAAGTDVILHTPETGGPWSYTQMVGPAFQIDGSGYAVPLVAADGTYGGYMQTPVVGSDREPGFAATLDFEITDLTTQGQYLELRLLDNVINDHQALFRISYNFDSGAAYGHFQAQNTLMPANSVQFSQSATLDAAFAGLGLGKHTFRLEIAPNYYRALIDGVEVGKFTEHGFSPATARMQINYYAIAGATPWKFDYAKVQGFTPAGYVAPLADAPIFSGTFTKTETLDLNFTVFESAQGAAGVKIYVNDVDTPYVYGSNASGSYVSATGLNVTAGDRLLITAHDKTKITELHFEAYDVLSDAGGLPANYFEYLANLKTFSIHNCHQAGALPAFPAQAQIADLEAYESNLTGALPDLSHLYVLNYLDLNTNQLSGALPDLGSTQVTDVYLHNNQFTDFTGGLPPTLNKLWVMGNALTQQAVDNILAALVTAANPAASGKQVDLSGGTNAAPSAAGAASVATLQAAGWTVSTN